MIQTEVNTQDEINKLDGKSKNSGKVNTAKWSNVQKGIERDSIIQESIRIESIMI